MRTFAISYFHSTGKFDVHEIEENGDYNTVEPLASFSSFADAQAFSAMWASPTQDLRFSYYTQEEAHAAQHAQGIEHDHFDNGDQNA